MNNELGIMNDYDQNLPRKRIGAGALIFNEKGEILVVKPSYKDRWSIPGGVVEKNESPRNACIRETKEEVGITLTNLRFLCVDYTQSTHEKSESLQFIFYGEKLSPKQITEIKVDGKEILEHRFVGTQEAVVLLGGSTRNLAKRLPKCLRALQENLPIYLEDGEFS